LTTTVPPSASATRYVVGEDRRRAGWHTVLRIALPFVIFIAAEV
jgi:hypothetical protein